MSDCDIPGKCPFCGEHTYCVNSRAYQGHTVLPTQRAQCEHECGLEAPHLACRCVKCGELWRANPDLGGNIVLPTSPDDDDPVLRGKDAERFLEAAKITQPISADRKVWMDDVVEQSKQAEATSPAVPPFSINDALMEIGRIVLAGMQEGAGFLFRADLVREVLKKLDGDSSSGELCGSTETNHRCPSFIQYCEFCGSRMVAGDIQGVFTCNNRKCKAPQYTGGAAPSGERTQKGNDDGHST
jgi:hypothetical protein